LKIKRYHYYDWRNWKIRNARFYLNYEYQDLKLNLKSRKAILVVTTKCKFNSIEMKSKLMCKSLYKENICIWWQISPENLRLN